MPSGGNNIHGVGTSETLLPEWDVTRHLARYLVHHETLDIAIANFPGLTVDMLPPSRARQAPELPDVAELARVAAANGE